ncbi:MAG: hypothetical protein HY738_17265 [Bacteroidia bacterium]|nr:hypothetical protein [Bacteroidia bacterium]
MILSFPDGNEGLIKLKQEHYNEKLAQIVSNKVMDISGNGLNYLGVHEAYDEFIQIKDPVYKYPESNCGRAHFYAPVKKLFGIFIDTYWFDCLIIWLAAFTLYLTLLHDTLRKILTYLGNINIIQKFSKKPKRL